MDKQEQPLTSLTSSFPPFIIFLLQILFVLNLVVFDDNSNVVVDVVVVVTVAPIVVLVVSGFRLLHFLSPPLLSSLSPRPLLVINVTV